MAKQDVVNAIPAEVKENVNKLVEGIVAKANEITAEKDELFNKGTKASLGRIRKGAQELKKLGQLVRVAMIDVRNAIAKK